MSLKGYIEELKVRKFDEWDYSTISFVLNLFL